MLGKLLKHEFMATGRFMWVIYAAMVALSVGANFSLRYLERGTNQILEALTVLVTVIWALSLVIGMVATIVLMVRQFQKNLLTDEGYLMFTLPGTVHHLVLSKIIVAAVWFMASIAVIILCCVIAVFESSFLRGITEFFRAVADAMTVKFAINGTAVIIELLVLLFLGCASACLQFYSAISIGYGFNNHKALWSVVFYFIQSTVLQVLGIILMVMFANSEIMVSSNVVVRMTEMQAWHLEMLIFCGLELILCAVFYIITVLNLQKRLNLA